MLKTHGLAWASPSYSINAFYAANAPLIADLERKIVMVLINNSAPSFYHSFNMLWWVDSVKT